METCSNCGSFLSWNASECKYECAKCGQEYFANNIKPSVSICFDCAKNASNCIWMRDGIERLDWLIEERPIKVGRKTLWGIIVKKCGGFVANRKK